jgi:hypothetical protein
MKKLFGHIAFLFVGVVAFAHPGTGIVMDSRGNVFYTDLKQVWKISPDGKKSIALSNVHTHELYIDAQDNLYGEHLWYEGEAIDKWGHRVWCLKADGTLLQIISSREGFREEYKDFFFLRDRAGNMYWADRSEPTVIRKRTPDGVITDLCKTHNFRDVRWMTVSAEGTVYLTDDDDLRRITPDGVVATIARNLKERSLFEFFWGDQHNLMGLWLDAEENVYVAVLGARKVKKVSRDGRVEVVARSSAPWSPTGGFVAPNGDLWLLEYGGGFAARARRISRDGADKTF